jgi:hypothetical protein
MGKTCIPDLRHGYWVIPPRPYAKWVLVPLEASARWPNLGQSIGDIGDRDLCESAHMQ